MTAILCASTRCGLPGQHRPDADDHDEACRGCLPAMAADGLRLCPLHTARLADDALHVATLHAAILGQIARPVAAGGQAVDGTRTPGLDIGETAEECLTALRGALRQLSAWIASQRGLTRPGDVPDQQALWIAAQASWVAARPEAGQWSDELADLRTDPRTRATAYPARSVAIHIGPCPLDDCGGRLAATPGQDVVACPRCGAEATVEQWRAVLTDRAEAVCDAYAIAARLSTLYGRPITPKTIRHWGWRGQIDMLTTADPRWHNLAARADCKPAPGSRRVALRDLTGRALYWWDSALERAAKVYGRPA